MRFHAQAIVLAAGSGSKMTAIVKRIPKCLLPVANHPMIFYPLYMLRQSGFTEATVVVSTKTESGVKKAIDRLNLDIKVEILSIDVSDDPGTADTLRMIAHKIKKNVEDVLLISSDIVSNVSLEDMMIKHISLGAMLMMLTSKLDSSKVIVPGPKLKSNPGADVLYIEEETTDVKYSVADGDYEGRLRISKCDLSGMKQALECFAEKDDHLYILKRWVFDYILNKDSICSSMISVKAEVIPHVIASQSIQRKDGEVKILDDFIKKHRYEDLITMYNTSTKRGKYNAANPEKKICQSFFHETVCRTNTLAAYWMMNKKMMTSYEKYVTTGIKRRHVTANIHEKAQVCSQSFVGKKAIISEKTNIKNASIGNNCKIQTLARISDSVVFDQVTISSGAVIEDSIICTSIDRKCRLRNCIVMDAYTLEDDRTYENEIIESSQVFS